MLILFQGLGCVGAVCRGSRIEISWAVLQIDSVTDPDLHNWQCKSGYSTVLEEVTASMRGY